MRQEISDRLKGWGALLFWVGLIIAVVYAIVNPSGKEKPIIRHRHTYSDPRRFEIGLDEKDSVFENDSVYIFIRKLDTVYYDKNPNHEPRRNYYEPVDNDNGRDY